MQLTSPVSQLISSHGVGHHQYADDTQLVLSMRASTIHSDLMKLEMCTRLVKSWFADLLLNADKSEVMTIGTPYQLLSYVWLDYSRLDYCNSVLYGAPNSTIVKLQRV